MDDKVEPVVFVAVKLDKAITPAERAERQFGAIHSERFIVFPAFATAKFFQVD